MAHSSPTVSSITGGSIDDNGWGANLINPSIASGTNPSFTNVGEAVTGGKGGGWDTLFPDKPQLATPGAVPTQGQAGQTALTGELQQEKNMRSSWNILTGGQGVLDNPRTAGPTLLGS